jgi:hypothetical protein
MHPHADEHRCLRCCCCFGLLQLLRLEAEAREVGAIVPPWHLAAAAAGLPPELIAATGKLIRL